MTGFGRIQVNWQDRLRRRQCYPVWNAVEHSTDMVTVLGRRPVYTLIFLFILG
jgi:hypothetical protein